MHRGVGFSLRVAFGSDNPISIAPLNCPSFFLPRPPIARVFIFFSPTGRRPQTHARSSAIRIPWKETAIGGLGACVPLEPGASRRGAFVRGPRALLGIGFFHLPRPGRKNRCDWRRRGGMGAWVSGLLGVDGAAPAAAAGPAAVGLGDLPELCAAQVLLRLDPPEICRLARLNHAFRGAAGADFVWEAKLPDNYRYLMEFVGSGEEGRRRRRRAGKKEIYARLARPVPFGDGQKEFWLDKSKGMICMALSSKALVITGIDDRRYWQHMPTSESRFQSVAYLQQIWWFEVVGEVDFCFPVGTYSLYFRVHLGKFYKRFGRRQYTSEHVHGWDKKPVRFQLSTSDGQQSLSQCYLEEPGSWVMYHAGDFVASKPDQPMKLKFSMAQIDCTHTKGGLCVDSVLIYPKGKAFQQQGRVVRSQK